MKTLHLLSLTAFLLTMQACGGSKSQKLEIPPLQSATQNETTQETTLPQNGLSTQQQELLTLHNAARKDVGIHAPLRWSADVAADAQLYADKLGKSGVWGVHDPDNHTSFYSNGPYGENLYTAYDSAGSIPSLAKASKVWIDEQAFYHYGKIGDASTCDTGKQCGHYTQIIWKNTTEVGCGRSRYEIGEYKDWYVIVCKYKTPGNIVGSTPY